MSVKTVNLWENAPGEYEKVPTMDIYIPEKKTTDLAIVVLPGGAYQFLASHEGQGYAEFLNEHGITAFVLSYRVNPYHFPLPLLDARRAMRYVRYHSAEFGIDKNQIVNTELHIYPQGPHGKGLAQDLPHTQNWTRELLEWLYLDDI